MKLNGRATLVLLLSLFCCVTSPMFATHIVGGDLSYICVGPGQYEFELIIYRECQAGSNFDGQPNINIFKANSTSPVQQFAASDPIISKVPINDVDPCLSIPPDICLEKMVSTFTANLPISNRTYYVVHQSCCRNNGVSNIEDSGGTGSTYFVTINGKAQQVCNNSAVFNNFPPPLLCVNEPISFDHSASDIDGDEIVYELCTPLDDAFGQLNPVNASAPPYDGVVFKAPFYNALNPIGGTPPVTINSSTGEITGTPNNVGLFVVGVCASEYRNGQLVGTIQRDFQFNITYCPPLVDAQLDGEGADDLFVYKTCGETEIEFTNESTEEAFIQEYYWEFPLPNQAPVTFSSRDVTYDFPGPGRYDGLMILNPGSDCTDSTWIEINISPGFTPDFTTDYDTCISGPVNFFDLTLENPGFEFVSRQWSFGDGDSSSLFNPVHQYDQPGSYEVSLTLVDTVGCTETVRKTIDWFPVPATLIFEPSAYAGCPGEEFIFSTSPDPFDENYQIFWDFGDGNTATTLETAHAYEEGGIYSITIEVISSLGCSTIEEFTNWITVDSFPQAAFSWRPTQGISNFEPVVVFQNESLRAEEFDWLFGENGIDYSENPSFTFRDTGLQRVQLIASSPNGCLDTLIQWVDVVPEITYHLPNAFTPNGDGINDEFRGVGLGEGINDFQLLIINRWGELIFESQSPDIGWNGNVRNTGKAAPTGVYTYTLRYRHPRGKLVETKGFATLFR